MRTDLLTKVLEMESKGREVQTPNEQHCGRIAERSRRLLMSVIIRAKPAREHAAFDLFAGQSRCRTLSGRSQNRRRRDGRFTRSSESATEDTWLPFVPQPSDKNLRCCGFTREAHPRGYVTPTLSASRRRHDRWRHPVYDRRTGRRRLAPSASSSLRRSPLGTPRPGRQIAEPPSAAHTPHRRNRPRDAYEKTMTCFRVSAKDAHRRRTSHGYSEAEDSSHSPLQLV